MQDAAYFPKKTLVAAQVLSGSRNGRQSNQLQEDTRHDGHQHPNQPD
jgi:hypothetical protein